MARALITGGSSGIGLELAKRFAQDGYNLIIIGRHHREVRRAKQTLEKFGVEVHAAIIDIAHPGAPQTIFDAVQKIGPIDILVNDAGANIPDRFRNSDVDEQSYTIDTNIRALTVLTQLFLPQLIQRRGKLLNLTSNISPKPGAATHYATTTYVRSFTEALAEELEGRVSVKTLTPPRIERANALSATSPSFEVTDAVEKGYAAFMRTASEKRATQSRAALPARRAFSRISEGLFDKR